MHGVFCSYGLMSEGNQCVTHVADWLVHANEPDVGSA